MGMLGRTVQPKHILITKGTLALSLLLLLAALTACGGGNGPDSKGTYHPSNWLAGHAGQALADVEHCKLCHEMTVLKVGSSIPNCMTAACHHGTIPGFNLAASHGLRAKARQDATGGGMVSCQTCHGAGFEGAGTGVSCQSCHGVPAPHPAKPWRGTGVLTHATTDPSNAPVCAQCHLAGSPNNPAGHPAQPAPAGTVPTCFNETMCHGAASPHILGAVWTDPTSSAFHGLEAKKDLLACQACHGLAGTTLFSGGSASTACTTCHTAALAHSTTWYQAPVATFPGYVPSHRNAQNRDTACAVCHDYTQGRPAPLPAAPSCYASSKDAVACHANGPGQPNHLVPFQGSAHFGATTASFNADCANCHAASGTSPLSGAPSCATCHQAGSPLVKTSCTSCHNKPPVGTTFPDVTGSHPKHDALAKVTGQCATCHNNADTGTLAHYNHANARTGMDALRTPPAPVQFLATFNAKAGAGSMNTTTLTCSNVSCHGAVTTPAWGTGTISINTDAGCRQCHQLGTALATPEANSEWSGLHSFHLGASVAALCTDCHSMTNGTTGANNHFAHLDTPQMEGPASDTILLLGSASNTYDAVNHTCTVTCHGTAHTAFSWNGGPSHLVPFLGTGHTSTSSSSTFNTNCASCHASSGTSPMVSAPSCAVCHQAASPLTVGSCASCHSKPPVGANFPDIAGTHSVHAPFVAATSQCGACHSGTDSGTQNHYDRGNARTGHDALRVPPAPVAFNASFNAKAGTGAFNTTALTCSNVSCHGALVTPNWRTGTLDATGASGDTGCRACHASGSSLGTPENNSYYSGEHSKHLGSEVNAKCTDCHAMANGTPGANAHFTHLETAAMEGPASDTIQVNGSRAVYNATNKTCTLTCHNQQHNAERW